MHIQVLLFDPKFLLEDSREKGDTAKLWSRRK
jgi:hypothetical protein